MLNNYITGIQHIGIPTNCMEDTIKFYTDLGFEILLQTVNEAASEKVTFLGNKNLIIESYENRQAILKNGAIDHICIDVKDIEKVFQIIESKGYEVLEGQIQSLPFWENGVSYFTIVGPNKEKIEFCQKL